MMEYDVKVRKEVAETISSLCHWINDRTNQNKVTSGNELSILPEVIKATAELVKSFR